MAKLKDLKVTIGLSKKGLTKLNSDLRSTKANFRRNFGQIQAMAQNMAVAKGGEEPIEAGGAGVAAAEIVA